MGRLALMQLPLPAVTGATSPLLGLQVKLERNIDKTKPCHRNVATVHPGKGPHAGELRCADCDRHRGWLSKEAGEQLLAVIEKFGMPTEPLIIRKTPIRLHRAGGIGFTLRETTRHPMEPQPNIPTAADVLKRQREEHGVIGPADKLPAVTNGSDASRHT